MSGEAQRGEALRARAFGGKHESIVALMDELDPELARWTDEFIFGEVWARGGLEMEERFIVAIVALTVGGKVDQLRNYLHGALQDGVSPEKIQEALMMTCVYAGFPSALNALVCWKEVRASHERSCPQ